MQLKLTLLHGCFSSFLNCTNGTKSRNTPQLFYHHLQKIAVAMSNPITNQETGKIHVSFSEKEIKLILNKGAY